MSPAWRPWCSPRGLGDQNGDGVVNDDVRRPPQSSAQDLGVAGRDPQHGFGLVDALAAVSAAQGPPPPVAPVFLPPTDLQASLANRAVTLTWTDNSNVEAGHEVQIGRWKRRSVNWSTWNVTGPDVTTFVGSLGKGIFSFRVRAMTGNPVTHTEPSNKATVTIR